MVEREVGGTFKMGETRVYLWLARVGVWQKTSQYCNYPSVKKIIVKHLKIMMNEVLLNT